MKNYLRLRYVTGKHHPGTACSPFIIQMIRQIFQQCYRFLKRKISGFRFQFFNQLLLLAHTFHPPRFHDNICRKDLQLFLVANLHIAKNVTGLSPLFCPGHNSSKSFGALKRRKKHLTYEIYGRIMRANEQRRSLMDRQIVCVSMSAFSFG